jgi:uncharacterized protein
MDFTLTREEKLILLETARESIVSKLEKRSGRYPDVTEKLQTVCGAFVTLHTEGELRGCIGNIRGIDALHEGVRELARSSAFHDPRFPPLRADELDTLSIEISVLSPLEKADSPDEVEVGTHGLLIRSKSRSGVLLPQVPAEQGWDREQFIHHTCRKAGLPPGCLNREDTELFLFTALVFGEEDFEE